MSLFLKFALIQTILANYCLKTTFPLWLSKYYLSGTEWKYYEDILSFDIDY